LRVKDSESRVMGQGSRGLGLGFGVYQSESSNARSDIAPLPAPLYLPVHLLASIPPSSCVKLQSSIDPFIPVIEGSRAPHLSLARSRVKPLSLYPCVSRGKPLSLHPCVSMSVSESVSVGLPEVSLCHPASDPSTGIGLRSLRPPRTQRHLG
jgi:hypothetical protein